jgi:hypothetical protein
LSGGSLAATLRDGVAALGLELGEAWLDKLLAYLGITETTVKVHRSNMMRKIKATSLAELCRMVDKLRMLPERPESH